MNTFRKSTFSNNSRRFAAILGAVAVLGISGILSWATFTAGDSRPNPLVSTAEAGQPLTGEQTKGVATALAAGPSEPGLSGWNSDLDWLSKKSMATQGFVEQPSAENAKPLWQPQALDLPLATPSKSRSEPVGSETKSIKLQPAEHLEHLEHQAAIETPKRAPRDLKPEPAHATTSKPQAPKPHRIAARPSYTEKVVEQGDSGAVTFRYRRQVCAPPHMVDVCYMPAENRRNIVVERW
jgi:hypothetical protein